MDCESMTRAQIFAIRRRLAANPENPDMGGSLAGRIRISGTAHSVEDEAGQLLHISHTMKVVGAPS